MAKLRFKVKMALASSDGWSLKRNEIIEVESGQGFKGCPFKQIIALSKGPVIEQLDSSVNEAKTTLAELEAKEKAQTEKAAKKKKGKKEDADAPETENAGLDDKE